MWWRYPLAMAVGVGTYLVARSQGAPGWGAGVATVIVTLVVLEMTALWKDSR